MTTNTIPDSTKLPCGPDRIELAPIHLSISGVYDDSGSRHNVQLQENGDLAVVLKRGQSSIETDNVPCNVDDTGLVVVSLGVDGGEHDAVHYSSHGGCEAEEVLGQAIDALLMCRDALRRVSRL